MQRAKYAPGQWDLSDLRPEGGAARGRGSVEAAREKAERFGKIRPRLPGFSARDVEAALTLYEGIADDISRAAACAYMKHSADTADQKAKAALDAAEELRAEVDNAVLFFRLWWTGLDERKARALAPRSPDHRYFLSSWRKLKPYTLEEKVEQAVNIKNVTGFSEWTHHYDQIASGFTFTLRVKGKLLKDEKGKPRVTVVDEMARMFHSPDPAVREASYRTVLGRYAENGGVLGEVYRTIVRDWRNENVKLRNYPTPISPRNLENDVSDAAVEKLLQACRDDAAVFQDFFRLKAKMLGMKRMSRYHIYAPLASKERQVTYQEAVSTVLDAYQAFDPGVAGMVRNVFEHRHVDATPRKGKRSGAYCMSVTPDVVPYVLLNFSGTSRDTYTIAHELGHAVHDQLASKHSVLTFRPPLVLAETASVFGEMILFDRSVREEKDPDVRRSLLLEKISSLYATIGRQAYFVVFENRAHEAVAEGSTVSELCDIYASVLKEQFGSAAEVPEEFKWEWSYIPHIYHTPFYCYAYAFGNLLSLALYDAYLSEGRTFVPKYLKLLSYGGSGAPASILSEVGIDIESSKFWRGGFEVVRRMVDELRRL